jgi:hypothetical protein
MAHTTTPTPVRPDPIAETPRHGSRVVIGWALAASGLAAAGVLILAVTSSGPAPEPATTSSNGSLVDVPRNPEIAERWLAHHSDVIGAGRPTTSWPAGVPQSADAADRWFVQQRYAGWPAGAPHSADGADRFLAQQHARQQSSASTPGRYAGWPEGVPHSADGADRILGQQR